MIEQLLRQLKYVSSIVSEVDSDLANSIRVEGLKTVSSIYLPDKDMLMNLGFGDLDHVRKVWGENVEEACRTIYEILVRLEEQVLATRDLARQEILELVAEGGLAGFRIYCHRAEISLFQSLFDVSLLSLSAENFITSKKQYLASDPFYSLFKIGPLRCFGWAKVPKVLISIPKYQVFRRIKLALVEDDEVMGQDPFNPDIDYRTDLFNRNVKTISDSSVPVESELYTDHIELEDILNFTPNHGISSEGDCLAVDLVDQMSILLPAGSSHLVLKSTDGFKSVRETKTHEFGIGDYLIHMDMHIHGQSVVADKTEMTELWKAALDSMYRNQYQALIANCEIAGIDLKNLDGALKSWRRPVSEGLHAPQSPVHFSLLIEKVLPVNTLKGHSWKEAWSEIRAYRAKAIQEGRLEHEAFRQQVQHTLQDHLEEIAACAAGSEQFTVDLEEPWGDGPLKFLKIKSINRGFVAPREKMGVLVHRSEVDLFRAEDA